MSALRLGPCPVRLLGSGAAFPVRLVDTPTLLAQLMPTLAGARGEARREALITQLAEDPGVATRAHLGPGEDPLELAVTAARQALAEAAEDVGLVVLATSTPTRWTTAESARLARALGLEVGFFDVRSGCTGGLWALVEGARLARDAGAPVLVVGWDSFSRAFGPAERMLPLAMGDGAAAVVLGPARGQAGAGGLEAAVFGGRPELVELATVSARLPPVEGEAFTLGGDPTVFAAAAEAALGHALDLLMAHGGAPELLAPHVSRRPTATRLGAARGLPVFTAGFEARGNLGAASLVYALHILRAQPHRRVALASAGGGLSYGAALWDLGPGGGA